MVWNHSDVLKMLHLSSSCRTSHDIPSFILPRYLRVTRPSNSKMGWRSSVKHCATKRSQKLEIYGCTLIQFLVSVRCLQQISANPVETQILSHATTVWRGDVDKSQESQKTTDGSLRGLSSHFASFINKGCVSKSARWSWHYIQNHMNIRDGINAKQAFIISCIQFTVISLIFFLFKLIVKLATPVPYFLGALWWLKLFSFIAGRWHSSPPTDQRLTWDCSPCGIPPYDWGGRCWKQTTWA